MAGNIAGSYSKYVATPKLRPEKLETEQRPCRIPDTYFNVLVQVETAMYGRVISFGRWVRSCANFYPFMIVFIVSDR